RSFLLAPGNHVADAVTLILKCPWEIYCLPSTVQTAGHFCWCTDWSHARWKRNRGCLPRGDNVGDCNICCISHAGIRQVVPMERLLRKRLPCCKRTLRTASLVFQERARPEDNICIAGMLMQSNGFPRSEDSLAHEY